MEEEKTVAEETAKSEDTNTEPSVPADAPDAEKEAALPIPVTEAGDAPHGARAPGLVSKIFSAAFSILFCGISLLYMTARAVDDVTRLASSGADRLLVTEVFGAAPETEEEERPAEPPDTEDVAAVTDAGEDKPGPPDADTYPLQYESLANFDLLTELFNETSYTPDVPSLAAKKYGVGALDGIYEKYGEDAPVVLIVHTHGTEAYSNGEYYTADESFRTEDTSKNVVAVGDVMEAALRAEGIGVIHSREMFDRLSYSESYSNSYAAVASFLKEYPSISYVIDVHRDSVFRSDGACVATSASVGGLKSAQVMIVVGTDEGGADHPDWEKNLSFAMNVQSAMASLEPSVPRKVNLRNAAFNQGLSPGSLLFEIGSCGNTADEAKRAAVVAALSLAAAIKGTDPSLGVDEAAELFAS